MQKTKDVTTNTGLVPGHNIRVRELAPIMGMSKNTISDTQISRILSRPHFEYHA